MMGLAPAVAKRYVFRTKPLAKNQATALPFTKCTDIEDTGRQFGELRNLRALLVCFATVRKRVNGEKPIVLDIWVED